MSKGSVSQRIASSLGGLGAGRAPASPLAAPATFPHKIDAGPGLAPLPETLPDPPGFLCPRLAVLNKLEGLLTSEVNGCVLERPENLLVASGSKPIDANLTGHKFSALGMGGTGKTGRAQ